MSVADAAPVRAGLPEWPHRFFRSFLRRRVVRRWDVHVRGVGHVPQDGPVILVSNHVGWLDGPVTVATSERVVHALVKHESFAGWPGRLLRASAQIELHRGRTDAAALRKALRVLRAGQVLLVYPEGKRGDGLVQETYGGAAYLALVTGAPVVPVAVLGTREPGAEIESKPAPGQRIDVVYGTPITIPAMPWPRDAFTVAAERERIADVLRVHVETTTQNLKRDLPGAPPKQDSFDE
ncbi:MAG: lysophospholipid acyltransferase family protein [Aeromicrobium sp.]|uniref:lysophospholipid acyltransferase family protein n=1 Tax=Aeromicrobium sp. TaxID=1871063 RepID=UPI0039E2E54B